MLARPLAPARSMSRLRLQMLWPAFISIRQARRAERTRARTAQPSRGYTFTMVNGILLNTSAVTNGPAALRGTWVGTIRSNSSGTIDFIFGTAGPVAGAFNVWNAYNRVSVGCTVIDQGAAYTYLSAIVRQARGSSGAANRVSFVVGSAEDAVIANYQNASCRTPRLRAPFVESGLGIDVTTAFSARRSGLRAAAPLAT